VSGIVSAAEALAPIARAAADQAERERRLPEEVVHGLIDAGIPNMLVPETLGGGEVHPSTFLEVTEKLAIADAAAAWCAMIAATSGLPAAYMDADAAREVYGPEDVAGGALAPRGRAKSASDGYEVSGRWPFNSGCQHCTLLMGGTLISPDGAASSEARPEFRLMLFPAADAEIIDTWSVSGLCGTGSHDIEVRELFVPESRAVSILGPPSDPGPLYVFPLFGLLAIGVAAVALGLARGAIDDLRELAGAKTPTLSTRRLAERPATQAAVAEAEASLRSARAYLEEAIADAWEAAEGEGRMGLERRALLRAAATHATRSSAEVVDRMYDAGGGTSIYRTSPLQRRSATSTPRPSTWWWLPPPSSWPAVCCWVLKSM
jgi:alkylation response protein AidB-like acyl-CoA dehydrogenase